MMTTTDNLQGRQVGPEFIGEHVLDEEADDDHHPALLAPQRTPSDHPVTPSDRITSSYSSRTARPSIDFFRPHHQTIGSYVSDH
eukprot:3273287-Rhodomonas_salina.1